MGESGREAAVRCHIGGILTKGFLPCDDGLVKATKLNKGQSNAFKRPGIFGHSIPGFWSLPTFAHLVAVFGALSPHLKIPFPAVGLEREVRPRFAPGIRDRGRALQLFRIESERLKLLAPFGRRIAEPLDADAAGQATFYRCFDKIGREEGERVVILTCRTLHFSRVQS